LTQNRPGPASPVPYRVQTRCETDCLVVIPCRSLIVASFLVSLGTVGKSVGVIRLQLDRLIEILDRALVVAFFEEREMSILFSDVRGFTTISELYKDDPQGLTSLMNSFLTPLTNAIIEHKGTIDKYMGDAIMAFWNAPLDDARHEHHAREAALEMLSRVERLNLEREQQAGETGQRFIPIKVGVGINTGRCIVGNMGSDLRFNYSVLGDPVNLASRLEGQSKTYGVPIIIGSRTAAVLRDTFAVLELDCITVKGKTEPESVFTVLGRSDVAGSERFERLHRTVGEMLLRFRKRDFAGAADAILRCRKLDDGFGLNSLYDLCAARIRVFEENPPPPDWNGVAVLESK
jgi:adenylate cyclase